MTENQRHLRDRAQHVPVAVGQVQIGVTDAAGVHADQDLAGARFGRGQVGKSKRLADFGKQRSFHQGQYPMQATLEVVKFLLLFLAGFGVARAELLVAAAADLAPAVERLQAGFPGVKFVLGSSGMLARQIENGAPFDVFLSANEQYVRDLAARGKVRGDVVTYAFGRLGLAGVADLEALRGVRLIAMPNPLHAPYGVAARQALEKRGVWPVVEKKIVYGENVRQALQFYESRNADAVITSWTLLKGKGVQLPAAWHAPVRQAAGAVSAKPEARAFLEYLQSAKVRAILVDCGLEVP